MHVLSIAAVSSMMDIKLSWQVEEETGICLNIEDMVNLTAFLDPTTGCKVFPSPVSYQLHCI